MSAAAEDSYEEPWCQLITIEGRHEERIPIIEKRYIIGRNKEANLVITDNKCVSGTHCTLVCDEDEQTWLQDTSTNGTLVDGRKIHCSQTVINDGADIKIVFNKSHPELNLSYKFIDLRSYNNTDSQDTIDMTLEYDDTTDGNTLKRRSTEQLTGEPINKKPSLDNEVIDKLHVGDDDSNVIVTECTSNNQSLSSGEGVSLLQQPDLGKKDSFEETLICQICQSILHDCVSLQPCMHCYCGGCYSDWMEYSQECPACRNKVDRISKNHIVINLVDAYLRAHPDKKRSDEDLKELDEKNKITKDMLYPKKSSFKSFSPDEEDSDDGSHGDSSDSYCSHGDHYTKLVPPAFHGTTLALSSPFFPSSFSSTPVPFTPVACRQCPGHTPLYTDTPPFTCTTSTNHILCNCCHQPMPDRRIDPDVTIPPQKCDVCSTAFCHMYWGCGKFGCRGCLNNFNDIDFNNSVLDYIINDNEYESEILKKYMEKKDLSVKDLLKECLEKLDNGVYTASDTRTSRISSLTRTCYNCALKNFKDLAYQYREGIPQDDLPSDVVARADCYYGRNCRTQKHSRDHCKRYNHVCDQRKY